MPETISVPEENNPEALVIGGGIAGLAACIHLARAGVNVACLEGTASNGYSVGESLDWSAPELLGALGLPADELLERGIATSKKHVILRLLDGSERHYEPGEWLGRSPYHVKLDTLHVDRAALDNAVRDIAIEYGVRLIPNRALRVEYHGRQITAAIADDGSSYKARWFIDSSGSGARILARAFHLPAHEYGPTKVAMWRHFSTEQWIEGTTLYGSTSSDGYMDWIWQIPIKPGTISIGCVSTAETVKEKRQSGLGLRDIYETRLSEFSPLVPFLKNMDTSAPHVTSFRCRVHEIASGPNWLVIGEAAAMVDPMTSNGVTAALRHAAEATQLLLKARHRTRLPRLATVAYNWRVRGLAKFFNNGIEHIMYRRPIRTRIGTLRAGDAYTIPAWLMNLFYARLRPKNIATTACFGCALILFRSIVAVCSWLCNRSRSQSSPLEGVLS